MKTGVILIFKTGYYEILVAHKFKSHVHASPLVTPRIKILLKCS